MHCHHSTAVAEGVQHVANKSATAVVDVLESVSEIGGRVAWEAYVTSELGESDARTLVGSLRLHSG